jgi:NACHT domain
LTDIAVAAGAYSRRYGGVRVRRFVAELDPKCCSGRLGLCVRVTMKGRILLFMVPFLTWLIQGAIGPAAFGLPVTWSATELAEAAGRWFRRLRRSDGLSRIVRAAAGGDLVLSDTEFAAVRDLLKDEDTWVLVGRGTVEDLAARIASCLPGHDSRSSLAAGRAVAAGLLEFATGDLEPQWFQRVLFARLDRLHTDQASALDQAMAGVHADLAALVAHRDVAEADRFGQLMGELSRVLDRLAPVSASEPEVAVYLAVLIRWLNTDPWLPGTPARGLAFAPAAVERKLTITCGGPGEQDADADGLGRQCVRLVVLGEPGAGKTWLARRTARLCAQAALEALAEGRMLAEVELPLYTTCARLAAAPPSEVIRSAVVSSALGQLPDLGGRRITDAVRKLFEERAAPTLLVTDSLDEARGVDERIRLADSLPATWRIVLTSRPAAWNGQLAIGKNDPDRRVGVLQPLRYPSDVEQIIVGWCSARPELAAYLSAQLRSRPALQQTATVPLILAFYCIVGGDQPLPGRRAALYDKVIRRMLAGRWSGGREVDLDPDACLDTLRDWAWLAAAANPVSGTGEWADEFSTPRARTHTRDERDALDHVAVPLGPADDDTGMSQRRFVHRSIRDHLVAEYIALRLPPEEAAGELLNHLWYDPDWEHAAPAALAMHPQRDQVLTYLIRRIARGDPPSADIAAIDGCQEIRRFLTRVAFESGEDDWLSESAEMIGQARRDIAASGSAGLHQVAARDWPTSNRLILESTLGLLAAETDRWQARELARAVVGLEPTEADLARARQALLGLLDTETDAWQARGLARAVVGLEPTEADLARARQALLGLLDTETDYRHVEPLVEAVAGLEPTDADLAQARRALLGLLDTETDPWHTLRLVETVAGLEPTEADLTGMRQTLLRRLATNARPWDAKPLARAVAGLEPDEADLTGARQALLGLLTAETDSGGARMLVEAVAGLEPTEADLTGMRQALLRRLATETDRMWAWAKLLTAMIAGLAVTAADQAQARQALLRRLAIETDPWQARELAEAVTGLEPTEADLAQARQALLKRLATETDPSEAQSLAGMVAGLEPTEAELAQARQALLGLLATETDPWHTWLLAEILVELAVTEAGVAQALQALLGLLAAVADPWQAQSLARAVAGLTVTEADRAQARQALLKRLATETISGWARSLGEMVAELEPTEADLAQARQALLELLANETHSQEAQPLARAIAELEPIEADLAQARQALLELLATETDPWQAQSLAGMVAELDPTEADLAQARQALLELLATETDPQQAQPLAEAVVWWEPTEADLAQARQALLGRLATETKPWQAEYLAEAVAELNPTVADLYGSDSWPCPPGTVLLAAARENSELFAWLGALPLL